MRAMLTEIGRECALHTATGMEALYGLVTAAIIGSVISYTLRRKRRAHE